jgi:hypothetical protein
MALSIPTPAAVASEQGTPCGIYIVSKNEVIAGVKFPKGDYQIYTFGMPCNKVLGKKGILVTFLKQKDKDPLPKPWRYTTDTVGAQGFSASGIGFRVKLIGSAKSTTTSNFAERWNATGSMAIKTMTKAFPAKSPSFPKVELTWRYSDTVNSKIKEEITKQYEHNIEFWSAYTKFDSPLQVIIGTLDDIQFVCKWRSSYLQINAGACETSFRTDKGRVWDAHTTQANGKATDFYFMTNPVNLNESDFLPRVSHEFFHNVQNAQTEKYKTVLPCWVEEGGAEYFGILVTSKGKAESFIKMRQYAVVQKSAWLSNRSLLNSKDYWRDYLLSADVTSINPNSYGWGCAPFQNTGLYGHILLATEFLHKELGIAGVLALYRDSGTIGWDMAIEKAFNKSKAVIYDEIASYMLTEYQIATQWVG